MVVLWPSNVHCHVHTHIHTHTQTFTFYKEKGELRKTSNVSLWSPHSLARMCIYAHKHIYVHIHHIKHTKDAKMPEKGWVKAKEAYLWPRAAGHLLRMLASALEDLIYTEAVCDSAPENPVTDSLSLQALGRKPGLQETAFLILFPLDETGTMGLPFPEPHFLCSMGCLSDRGYLHPQTLADSTLNNECVKTDPLGPGPPLPTFTFIGALARSLTLHASVSPSLNNSTNYHVKSRIAAS